MQPKFDYSSILADQQQLQTKIVPIVSQYDTSQTYTNISSSYYICSHCSQTIHERYLLYTEGRFCRGNYWHMQCLRCQFCDGVLADIASTFYTKDNLLLCKSDYMKYVYIEQRKKHIDVTNEISFVRKK
jgi:phage FluMu protein Com